MNLLQNASIIRYLARFNHHLWEILHPHVPLVSEGLRNIMISSLVRTVASHVTEIPAAQELQQIGKTIFDAGIKTVTYENSGGIFINEMMLNPQPIPPVGPAFYGAILSLLAESVTTPELKAAAENLNKIGFSLITSPR